LYNSVQEHLSFFVPKTKQMRPNRFLYIAILLCISTITYAQKKDPKEILLIGVFHFNNPGADLVRADKFDVMTAAAQAELHKINASIRSFAPDKVFVEWDYDEQSGLDTLYNLYLQDQYFDYVNKKYPGNSFFKENEIFQLGFRIAKSNRLEKVYGIDIATSFPFDSLLISMERAQQNELKEKIFSRIKEFESIDNANRKKYSLRDLLIQCNTQSQRDLDLGSYISLFNRAGVYDDFTGPDLVANWYKRNLLMYSLVQKISEQQDKRIVVILGASHIALFRHFIDLDENFKAVELTDILE